MGTLRWVALGYTLFLGVLVPVYWRCYGPANFLWFSDIALFLTAAALWLQNPWLASMAAVAVLLPELAWNLDFLWQLVTGRPGLGIAAYMFQADRPLALRALSLFHVALPPLLLWLVYRLGYEPRAWLALIPLAWAVLLASYLWTPPQLNINWVHGLGRGLPAGLSPTAYLFLLMLAFPLAIYLPTHLLLKYVFPGGR